MERVGEFDKGCRDFHFWMDLSEEKNLKALREFLITEYEGRDASNMDLSITDKEFHFDFLRENKTIIVKRCYSDEMDECPVCAQEQYHVKCSNRNTVFDSSTIEEWVDKVINALKDFGKFSCLKVHDESGRLNIDFNSASRVSVNFGGPDYHGNVSIDNPKVSRYFRR